jgi:hypothetical protein
MRKILYTFLLLCIVFTGWKTSAQEAGKSSMFSDSLDKAFDISNWLLDKKGFLIVPSVITEPAVGYGLAGAAVYFHSSYSQKNGPPSMSGLLGGGTQNGTWLAGVFHAGFWKQDRIRYLGALARTSANVGFYGSGNIELPDNKSVNLNLDAWLLMQQIKFRIAETDFFVGGRYIYLNTDNTFELPIDVPEFDTVQSQSTLSEISAVLDFDSRDNIFTSTKGCFLELTGTYSDTWIGGEALYGRIGATFIGYFPASKKVVFGIRHESHYSLGDVPYYARPIVNMRGVPLMKYQNINTTVFEGELNWNVYKRWHLIGFTGIGNAFSDFQSFNKGKSVTTIGTGFRYLIARKFGAQMGIDIAKSTGGQAFYIVFGSAWKR